MDTYRVADRPQNFDMIRWDGSVDAEAWVTARFPDDAGFGGPEGERVLVMFGSWEIPPGSYIIDRQGSFHHLPPDQVNHFYQLAKATNIPTEATTTPAPQQPTEPPVEAPAETPEQPVETPAETPEENPS